MTLERELETEPVSMKTKFSEAATSMVQTFTPLKGHRAHLNGIHLYANDPTRQIEANHYCSHLTEDIQQCIIYDSHDTEKARLIGVEYIIPRSVFETLPREERKYWHSHAYEVLSGSLYMPGVPQIMEDGEMKKLVDTYGKTWTFWQVDRGDVLPFGEPQLMCSITRDGQVNAQILKLRDEKFGISSQLKREHRMGKLDVPIIHPDADQFEKLNREQESLESNTDVGTTPRVLENKGSQSFSQSLPGENISLPKPTRETQSEEVASSA